MISLKVVESDLDLAHYGQMTQKMGQEAGVDPYGNDRSSVAWLIEDEQRGRVGFTSLHSIDWQARRARSTIWVDPRYRNWGIAHDAVIKRDRIGFSQYNLRRVEAGIEAHNLVSQRLHVACGYIYEGLVRQASYFNGAYHDYALYALMREGEN